ncbi:MAG: hypothetical protein JST16_07590 [Bdellovibrionales bacterium]|nr:hypothetical protein [Bdellovibrionales bacterium]
MKLISTKMAAATLAVLGLGATLAFTHEKEDFFAPQNDRQIPASFGAAASGISQDEFNQVLDRVSAYYSPVIKKKYGSFYINRKWTDNTVNASAQRFIFYYVINMYGGLARHPMMTSDGFTLVACHETGHHLGGAPKVGGSWASNEGESDYFANLQCAKNIFAQDDNVSIVRNMQVDPIVAAQCRHQFSDVKAEALCERISMAGYVISSVLGDLGGTGAVSFATPDTSVVGTTNDEHPAAQCRLDTYFAGALCTASPTAALSNTDYAQGTCASGTGSRPYCWFNPKSSSLKLMNGFLGNPNRIFY